MPNKRLNGLRRFLIQNGYKAGGGKVLTGVFSVFYGANADNKKNFRKTIDYFCRLLYNILQGKFFLK